MGKVGTRVFAVVATALVFIAISGNGRVKAEEAELTIVRYGKLSVKSTVPDAKVYVDDTYKGPADNVIDSIMVGEHTISCRTDTKTVSGKFSVKRDETLRLEARFEENKIVVLVEHEKVEKVEPEKKVKAEPKIEKPKKAAVEVKHEEKRDPVEERRELHLNMIKVFFDNIDTQDVRITHKTNPKVIAKFGEKKDQTGTYYRTKKNILLCDAGPCQQQWSATFQYTDEKNVTDSIGLTWKQTVFNGITPAGTSKRDLLYCLNNDCKTLEDVTAAGAPLSAAMGRYRITWSKNSLVIRRSDIMKEITDSGGVVEAY
jgi:hypothetical protein